MHTVILKKMVNYGINAQGIKEQIEIKIETSFLECFMCKENDKQNLWRSNQNGNNESDKKQKRIFRIATTG